MKTRILSLTYSTLCWLQAAAGRASIACRKRLDRALLQDLQDNRARRARRSSLPPSPPWWGLLLLATLGTLAGWAFFVIMLSF